MNLNTRRFSSDTGGIYFMCLFLNNLVAFAFIGMTFLANPAHFQVSAIEFIFGLIVYGFIVSLFFSLITLALDYRLKHKYSPVLTGHWKIFLLQFAFLFSISVVALILVFGF